MTNLRLRYILFCLSSYLVIAQSSNKQMSFRELTVEQGLSQNSVVSIAQDSIGYMWFATQDGLNKYDGRTFTFFNKQFEDVTRPTYSKLGKTYIDRDGILWIISNSGVLEKFNDNQQQFQKVSAISDVSCIFQGSKKDYYIGTFGDGFYKIENESKDTLRIFNDQLKNTNIYDILEIDNLSFLATSNGVFRVDGQTISKLNTQASTRNFSTLATTKDQDIWLGSFDDGLYFKSNNAKRFQKFKHPLLPSVLNIQDLLVDNNNNLWLATYGNGLFMLEDSTQKVSHFTENKSDPYALHYNDVLCLYQDFTGTIWLGTDGAGLSYYDQHLKKFNVITNAQTPTNVSVDVVRAITTNAKNEMWLGTSGKGLTRINALTNNYKTYTTQNSNLMSDRIMSLLFSNDELWIGLQGEGLQILDPSGRFKNMDILSNQTVWKIYAHNTYQNWLCTRDSGLLLFDKNQGVLKDYTQENSALTTNNIRTIEKGNTADMWIGSEDNGLFLLNTESQTIEKIEPISNKIKSLYFDGQTLWIGTNGNGLKSYNTVDKKVHDYTIDHGLSNNVIYAILPDDLGNLWLSSNKGITRFNHNDSTNLQIENFSKSSGLQALEFNTGSYFKDENGTLYFGGLEGVNWFLPSQLTSNQAKPKTIISKFEVFGKQQPMVANTEFRHNENTMTFTFAGLHFSQPEENLYRYKLLNHDEDWTVPNHNNVAHYTNLPPNDYTFMVLSSNYDGIWNKNPTTYAFTILKPWYLTNTLKVIYVLLVLLLIYSIYKYLEFRWHVKTQLQLEHAETERLKKLDEFKTKLYTNISHEFRTPLTLISGPIDHQLSKEDLKPDDRKELNLVKQNANRLLNLVNQMLDLSLIDSGQLRLKVNQGNLNVLLKQIVAAFQYKANQKNISIKSAIENLETVWYDTDIIEKIASNLLSNAIKYAPEESAIIFDANSQDKAMVLSIINVNHTISKTDIGKLFQRFYQDNTTSDGVGVGLALVKELVTLSKGSIIANTLDQDKIQFTVTLPIHKDAFSTSEIIRDTTHESEIATQTITPYPINDAPILLIVEDDYDIRSFIKSIFQASYQIIEAENGKVGVELALEYIPDVIISDIMMPVQDGIELCNTLKDNELTSHIPIILLTAKVGEENEIEGLKTGADAYITKPFNQEKLKLRVIKLIENRKQLQKYFSKDFAIDTNIEITSTETEFLKRLKMVMDDHITNSEFTSEAFAEAMQMSRTQLHRKLKAIVGMTTSEFIRSQRLKLALQLLKESDATISEIAYQVGFNTPSYFIKCFKETYHCTPNDYLKN